MRLPPLMFSIFLAIFCSPVITAYRISKLHFLYCISSVFPPSSVWAPSLLSL